MKKIILSIIAIFMGGIITTTPIAAVFAENCTFTSVLGNAKCTKNADGKAERNVAGTYNCSCDDGNGSEINRVLQELVIPILSISVGIVAVIGISIVGIQYLTAGGNEERTRKAKRRMIEIIIGVAIYIVLAALVNWLMPKQ